MDAKKFLTNEELDSRTIDKKAQEKVSASIQRMESASAPDEAQIVALAPLAVGDTFYKKLVTHLESSSESGVYDNDAKTLTTNQVALTFTQSVFLSSPHANLHFSRERPICLK